MNRRSFLKTAGVLASAAGVMTRENLTLQAADVSKGAPHAEKLGWRLGCQAWTFNRFTFYEAMDKTAELGLHFIEGYPNQSTSADKPSAATQATRPATDNAPSGPTNGATRSAAKRDEKRGWR